MYFSVGDGWSCLYKLKRSSGGSNGLFIFGGMWPKALSMPYQFKKVIKIVIPLLYPALRAYGENAVPGGVIVGN